MKNNEEVKRQRNAKRMKVEIARELGEKKAAEKTIERTFFRKLYDSKYCIKGDPKVVSLRSIGRSQTAGHWFRCKWIRLLGRSAS